MHPKPSNRGIRCPCHQLCSALATRPPSVFDMSSPSVDASSSDPPLPLKKEDWATHASLSPCPHVCRVSGATDRGTTWDISGLLRPPLAQPRPGSSACCTCMRPRYSILALPPLLCCTCMPTKRRTTFTRRGRSHFRNPQTLIPLHKSPEEPRQAVEEGTRSAKAQHKSPGSLCEADCLGSWV